MAVDIAPELLAAIREDWNREMQRSRQIQNLRERFDNGRGGFLQAEHYAAEAGRLLSNAFKANLTEEILPNGRVYYNIANRIIPPMLQSDYEDITAQTAKVVKRLNEEEGIGLNAVIPDFSDEENRVKGLVDGISNQDTLDKALFYVGEPIVNFSVHAVDMMAKRNGEFQRSVGLYSVIIRSSNGKCCPWCDQFVGEYVPGRAGEAYARHENCNCLVEFKPKRIRAR